MAKKWGILIKKESESLIFTGLEIPRDYDIEWEGWIHLRVTGDADFIRISVKDNGKGMTQQQIDRVLSGNRDERREESDSTGIGMNNVISRLELYYEEEELVEIHSEGEGKGTEIVIYIPI